MKEKFEFNPIGYVRIGAGIYPQEAPRQAIYASNTGVIELISGYNFEQALDDLDGIERIWLIFVFDRNKNWSPKVLPPDGSEKKRGLFSTRAPYRPNPIGISPVELIRIEKLKLYVRNLDLLDGTPILDIKPYVAEIDAFPNSLCGWRSHTLAETNEINYSTLAEEKINFLIGISGPDLKNFIKTQLGSRSLDEKKQRLKLIDKTANKYEVSFRTWRIHFSQRQNNEYFILDIFSGYNKEEIADLNSDIYNDKKIHEKFINNFSKSEKSPT